MSIVRHRPVEVQPLEVWDVVVAGRPLFVVEPGDHAAAVAAMTVLLQRGEARRFRGQVLAALPIERVVVAGGGDVEAVVGALLDRGIEARAAADPVAIARVGGLHVAEFSDDVLVVDIGQTSVKWFHNHRNDRVSRPPDLLLELETREGDPRVWRQRCIDFIASAISSSLQEMTKPKAAVIAWPCEIDDDLAVAGCSYPWPDGDPTLIAEIVSAAGLDDVRVLVVNDAELAAVSISVAGHGAGTLVLTLGLGVGAAFITA